MDVRFPIVGGEVVITAERDRYNSLRKEYAVLAAEAAARFISEYRASNHDLDDVNQKVLQQGLKQIWAAVDVTIRRLAVAGVNAVDRDKFVNDYYAQYCDWDQAVSVVTDRYMEIVLNEKDLDEYRRQRKQGRSRWVGGGFGLSGAIEGALAAGALNAVGGAAHSVINAVGKMVSSVDAAMKKARVFDDPSTLGGLAEGVGRSVFALHLALLDALAQHGRADAAAVSETDESTAAAMFRNVTAGMILAADVPRVLVEAISLDPYNPGYLQAVVDRYGDRNLEVDRLASYLGLLPEVAAHKRANLEAFAGQLPLSTEAEALASRQKAAEFCERMGLGCDHQWFTGVDARLLGFDAEARTVEGRVFATRDEAERIRGDEAARKRVREEIRVERERQKLAEYYEYLRKSNPLWTGYKLYLIGSTLIGVSIGLPPVGIPLTLWWLWALISKRRKAKQAWLAQQSNN